MGESNQFLPLAAEPLYQVILNTAILWGEADVQYNQYKTG